MRVAERNYDEELNTTNKNDINVFYIIYALFIVIRKINIKKIQVVMIDDNYL